MQCARHPKIETNLSCGKCGAPICPRCSIPGPVGMRCRDCASLRSSSLYQIRPERFALAIAAGLVSGLLVGFLLQFLSGFFLYFPLLAGPVIGGAVGDGIVRAAGGKRGLKLEILAGVSVIGGALLASLLSGEWMLLFAAARHPALLLHPLLYLVAVVLCASGAVGRIRYY